MLIQKENDNSVEVVAKFLKQKEVVVIPTDTIYGFSGIVPETKDKIFKLKQRKNSKELIALISNPYDIFEYTNTAIPSFLFELWPAPLTLIVKDKFTENSLAFRCPDDEWLRMVISKTGRPIYSTSVNYSGTPALTNIFEIQKEFENNVSLIVDGGVLAGKASTIISLLDKKITVIREGEIVKKLDKQIGL